ncbi:type VI secretion system tip protein VgrG [Escherichia coli]|nr:type VI secretion system tip protein TssI/VgrG [Escherichia coli]EFC4854718.1 type VI secretion system tip protein VgrG [Escherichia coli]EFO3263095.1 type IV secretion protein Rhs [Escherichia coli]EHC5069978.1 type VI secretion system tip protein VgrG [Escherichia coli]EJJ8098338.1 type VI secretion system tip protein VgrG [Escherichia coli]EJW9444346.1 type VI secretion system tip protein VgrG [Escherichia coli]
MSTGLRFTLEVDGLPPDAFAVVSFHLNQLLSSLFSLDLSLVSQQFLSLEFAQVLDKMAYLTIWQGDEVQRRVKGVVTWFELGENDKNQMLYSMKVCPPLWRTGLRQNFRIFQNEDIESILATILKENGVTEWSPLFSEPHPSREFCVQYGETDYDFLCRMAAEEGIFFYEEHAQKSTDQSLVLCDTVRYLPESFEIPWNPNTRTEVSTLCISQFRYSAQIRPSSVVTKDYTFKRPGWAGRFDQEGQYRREAAGDLAGEITGVTDGAGREFRLVLTTQAQRAEEARTSSLSSSDSSRPLSASPFPDTLPGTEYGPDRGIRLSAVWLMHDPAYPESLPGAPLARYTYTEAGELLAVYDRSNTQVRAFTYDAQHPGRMVAHRYAGRPEMRYRYDDTGRVVEQLNPAGLSYRYQYEQDRITVTDSLNRREVLHTEGGAGLKRVVKKELADGRVTHSGYDAAGRLTAQTDAAGRRTEYGLNVVSGDITDITTPDGRETKFYYNDGNQLTAVVSPDGLESRREYDEPGRLVSETSRSGETVRYRYDDAHSELPATTTDATGSTRQMTWSRYGQLLAFTDCSGYQTRYEYDRFGQMTAVHREEGISLYRHYDNRGRLTSVKDAQGRETQYEYNAAGDLTAVITPDGNRSETQYDAWGKAVSTTQGGLTRSMEYDAAGRVISLTNENGSHSDFSYDALDRLVQQGGFDGRTQRYHYDLTGKLTQSEDEGLVTLWYYDESDRITHRTVNGEPAEQWQYDDHGWLTDISHLSEGHRVAVHYGYDDKGRLTGERQTVENPETGELLWQHETTHAYNEQGLANRVTPDSLPPVEWLTYGSGYLAGMKLGDTPLLEYTRDRMHREPDGLPPVEWLTYGSGYLAGMKLGGTPLVEYTRDRLHRETARSFGGAGSTAGYEQATAYTLTGQLQSRHLNLPQLDCDYTWNDNGQLVRISGPQECREYRYSGTGRLTGVHTTAANLDIDIPYATDPAGNRLPDPELHPDSTLTAWPDNRIAEDAHYVYRYDEYGRLAEKTDRIPEGVIRMHDERTHHYHYDSQHRLVFYTRIQHGEPQVESRYLYDPLGRRTGKRVWRRERDLTGWMSLSRKPEETWYGWDGDRLTTVQTQQTRIQTVYQPGSFTPLLRIETENGEQAKARHRSLAEVLQEDTGVTLPAELAVMLGRLERELRQGSVSEESQQWLAQCGLTAEQMAAQLEAEYIPERKLHLYHCDHRGLPLALISPEGETAWQGEYDEWGNLLGEESAQHLQQSLRLPGQQYDEESGLYYNRNRYYDPLQGRYITQDPIGLRGEWNLYKYPLNPVRFIDSLGLKFHVNGDPSDFNQAVEYLKQDSQMKETIDFLSSSEETINIEYIEGTNVRFNSNNMAIYWNSRASLFCSTELNSKSQSPALGLGHEFAHAQYYLLDKENFMALLSRTDKKYENKEEARVITIIESRAAKTLGECTRGAHSGLPFYRVDGPLQTMKITGTPE